MMQKLKFVREQEAHLVELRLSGSRGEDEGEFVLTMTYLSGDLGLKTGTLVARFTASYQTPAGNASGHVDLGQGDTKIEVPKLRGMGIGSFMMSILIGLVQSSLPQVEVAMIYLASEDAKTDEERDRRNGFWRKLGYTFTYYDSEERSGYSNWMMSSQLIRPAEELRSGWIVEELE